MKLHKKDCYPSKIEKLCDISHLQLVKHQQNKSSAYHGECLYRAE